MDTVYLISGPLKKQMDLERHEEFFDYYVTQIQLGEEALRYFFEIKSGKMHCFYNKMGVTRDLSDSRAFSIQPGFSTPDWAKGAVMYQIYTDRFFNGDETNDVLDNEYIYIKEGTRRVTDWGKTARRHGRPGVLRRRSGRGAPEAGLPERAGSGCDLL